MLSEILSIVGIGNAYISGIKTGKKLDEIINESKQLNATIERLADHIFYAPNIEEIYSNRQKNVSDFRQIRESLEPIQKVFDGDLLSTAMVTTSDKLKEAFNKEPFEVLDFVRPINRTKDHPNPDMVPIIFEDQNVRYVGWIMKGLLPVVFGFEYNSKSKLHLPTLRPHELSIVEQSKRKNTQNQVLKRKDEKLKSIELQNSVSEDILTIQKRNLFKWLPRQNIIRSSIVLVLTITGAISILVYIVVPLTNTTVKPDQTQTSKNELIDDNYVYKDFTHSYTDSIYFSSGLVHLDKKTGKAFVIIGTFVDKYLAEDYAKELLAEGKYYNVYIVPPFDDHRFYRVAIAAYSSFANANDSLQNFRREFGDDIWALRY